MRRIVLLIAAIALPAQAADRSPIGQIRTLRAENNAALPARDFAAMRRHYLPDYTTLPGSSGVPFTT